MNDNGDRSKDVEIHLPEHFLIDEWWLDFYSMLPDFRTIDVYERRLSPRHGHRITIQLADQNSFLHVTAYYFG